MDENLNLIIDEPWNAGIDLAASRAWVDELNTLKSEGHDVDKYLKRARGLLAKAQVGEVSQPKTIEQAMTLLRREPLPDDIIEQLEALEAKTPPEWLERFGDFYEAAIAAE